MAESNTALSEHNFSNHLFREIYKNAWLNKVNANNSEKSGPNQSVFWIIQKPEKFWFVFCIHDDTEAYLEAYTDAKTSVMHRPVWTACLNDTLHVSSTICSEFKEYEFVVTLNSTVVRLLAPTRDAMNDWVDTLRTKLTEMKILSPCKNMYTALPQAKQTLLPTRDPTSPLPPPPSLTIPSIPPGTECILPVTPTTTTNTVNNFEIINSNSQEVSSNNCDMRGNTPSLINNSQRQVLRRNLSMPNSSEPYITVIQVSDSQSTESTTTAASSRPPHSAQPSSTHSAQIFDFNIDLTNNDSLSSDERAETELHAITTDLCELCNGRCNNTASTTCSHYDCVFVPDISETRLQLENVRPKIRSENSLVSSSSSSINHHTTNLEQMPASSSLNQSDQQQTNIPTEISTSTELPSTLGNNREVTRPPPPLRTVPPNSTIVGNLAREMTQLTLREQQVLRLQKEIKHPTGVRIQLSRKDCNNAIALVDVFGAVWVAGWKQKDNPMLYNLLHIGDQIINVEGVFVQTAADVHKHLRRACKCNNFVTVIIKRIPFGKIFVIQREMEGQPLGIVQEQNTAVIKQVLANSLAARHGLPQRATTCDQLSFTNWVLTEINGRPLNLFYKNNEIRDRLNAIGREISILVQPLDLIKQIKKQLKSIRNYKDYIVQ